MIGLFELIMSSFISNPEKVEKTILKEWDRRYKRAEFPYFGTDENSAATKARISAFRSNKEWLIVFEILSYVSEAGSYFDLIYSYGNRIKYTLSWYDFLHPTQEDIDEDKEWIPNPFDFNMVMHGVKKYYSFTHNDYTEAKIDLEKTVSGDQNLDKLINILRILSHFVPSDELFLPTKKILELLNRPKTLPILLKLEDWLHPDQIQYDLPSNSPSLQSLAKAVAYNEPNLYVYDHNQGNTHWSNWPNFFLWNTEMPC